MENAMEIVEIVNADDPKPDSACAVSADLDEHAIAEIARINSINKCNVWFEAHETMLDSQQLRGQGPQDTNTEHRPVDDH